MRWKGRGPMNTTTSNTLQRGYRAMSALITREEAEREAAAAGPLTPEQEVEARLWVALQDVEDPEIPISVVGMGLIVSIAFARRRASTSSSPTPRWAARRWTSSRTTSASGCCRSPRSIEVRIEVVWDPVWTRAMIREDARATMRRLGIVA